MKILKKKVSIITSIFGEFDEVPPLPFGFDEAILVSDKSIKSEWTNVNLDLGSLTPRLCAKIPKFRPDLFTNSAINVWIDASVRDPENWLHKACAHKIRTREMVLFKHPERTNVFEETSYSKNLKKYKNFQLDEQVNSYQKLSSFDGKNLYAGGVIVRRNTSKLENFGNEWFMENVVHSPQDQLSLPHLIKKYKINLAIFEENLFSGPLKHVKHRINDY
jgi:hypothetical protein